MVEVMLLGRCRRGHDSPLQSSIRSNVSFIYVVQVLEERQSHVRRERTEPLGQPVNVDDGTVESVQLTRDRLPVLALQQCWIRLFGPVLPSLFGWLVEA